MISFGDFLLQQEITPDRRGDFLKAARTDPKFPSGARNWREVRLYVFERGTYSVEVRPAHELWLAYQRQLARR